MSMDRIDVNGDYSPRNCRWTNVQTQGTNKRNTVFVFLDGERLSVSEACRRIGKNPAAVKDIRKRKQVTHQQALDLLASL